MVPIRRVNTTMPESLRRKVGQYSVLNLEDRATAIRQLVAEGLRVKLENDVLKISMLLFVRFRVHSPLPIIPLRDPPEAAPVTVEGKSLQYALLFLL